MMNTEQKNEYTKAEAINFYQNLLKIALEQIPESGSVIVVGPMFIIRSPEENFELFEKAQDELIKKGLSVFNQLPLLDHNLENAPFKYDLKFEIFYKNLIASGKIKACYLLPDWKKSEGARTEVEYCKQSNIPIFEI